MTEHLRLLWLSMLVLLGFFVAQFPASTAFAWFAPAGMGAFGVSGTLWRGNARLIRVGGLQLRNSEWDIVLSRLFTGQLAANFKSRWGNGFAEGYAAISGSGNLSVRELTASFNVGTLSALFDLPRMGGQVSVQINEVTLIDNWPRQFVGSGEIRGLSSPLMGAGDAQRIGDIRFEFNTETETNPDTITGKLSDSGGPLQLNGMLVLTPPGNYDVNVRVKARATAPATLHQNLQFLGAPEPDGTRIFQLAGSI